MTFQVRGEISQERGDGWGMNGETDDYGQLYGEKVVERIVESRSGIMLDDSGTVKR